MYGSTNTAHTGILRPVRHDIFRTGNSNNASRTHSSELWRLRDAQHTCTAFPTLKHAEGYSIIILR